MFVIKFRGLVSIGNRNVDRITVAQGVRISKYLALSDCLVHCCVTGSNYFTLVQNPVSTRNATIPTMVLMIKNDMITEMTLK